MTKETRVALEPRKRPKQARSAASVEAILEATAQVLVSLGKQRLTTTRVAARAGVSVGTLYQYFPNRSALLQAALERHLDDVTVAIEAVCRQKAGAPLREMATALVEAFLEAKMRNAAVSVSFYAVSADVEGAKIAQRKGERAHTAMAAMFRSSPEPLGKDPEMMAIMLRGTMVGISRQLLESPEPEGSLPGLRAELVFLAQTYVNGCRAT